MYFVNKLSDNGDDKALYEENCKLEEALKSMGGVVMQTSEIPHSVYNQFLKSVLAFEEADRSGSVLLIKLFPKDFTFPPVASMNPKRLSRKLEMIYEVLAENNVVVELQEGLPDVLVYRFLQQQIYTVKITGNRPGTRLHLNGCDWDCPHCFQRNYCATTLKERDEHTGKHGIDGK